MIEFSLIEINLIIQHNFIISRLGRVQKGI